jgi:RNA polymerase sigma-54 factor
VEFEEGGERDFGNEVPVHHTTPLVSRFRMNLREHGLAVIGSYDEERGTMRLNLVTKLEQQQILAPQMILSMDILLLNSIDLEARIEKEFMENPALELEEATTTEKQEATEEEKRDEEIQEIYEALDDFERRYGGEEAPRRGPVEASDNRHEALLNHADERHTLTDHLIQQISFLEVAPELAEVCRELAGNVDRRGYLMGDLEEIAPSISAPEGQLEQALEVIQSLDPPGVGARGLKECLLLQLRDDPKSLEYRIIEAHLADLIDNRLPRLAEAMEASLEEVKDAVELISLLDPQPGTSFGSSENHATIPEIFVDEIEGEFRVRMEEHILPNLRISASCAALVKEGGQNPQVIEFVKRKMEAARWLIHAIEQRWRTLIDIAQAIVDHQQEFLRRGPGHMAALTMQTIADRVGVHISTVSRATNGKYMETPYGVTELRRMFTGGVEKTGGGIESRDNICELIKEIVGAEDSCRPYSDSQLARKLQESGLEIARRTVTKYRERAEIPNARIRKKY